MDNEIKSLITTFKEYRDLLTPVEKNLKEFSLSFESISEDIKNLNSSFDGNLQSKLDKIYGELSSQAGKAKNLASQVDAFMSSTARYISSIDNLIRMAVANAKIVIGRIRTRFTQNNALYAQDGEKLLEEGNTELAELRQHLIENRNVFYPID